MPVRSTTDLRRPVSTIAVVMAMRDEAAPVVAALGAVSMAAPTGRVHEWYEARRGGIRVVVAVNGVEPRHGLDGIGVEPAVLNTAAVLDHVQPDLVVSAGTAGGWASRGGAIGTLYLAHPHVVRHDRRIPLAGFDRYGVGEFPVVPMRGVAAVLGAVPGVVTTGGSLDESPEDRRMIESSGAVAKDMEAAAVAYVCELYGVPCSALKAITDLHDVPVSSAEQFTANLAMASSRVADAVVQFVDAVAGRSLDELDT